jgi:hypothetical protein
MRRTVMIAALCLAAPAALHGQAPIARVTVSGGAFTDTRGIRAGAVTASPLVILSPAHELAIVLSATGTRFTTGTWAAAGTGGLVVRSPITPHATLAIDAGAGGTVTSWHTRYLSAQSVPALEFRTGPLTVSAGVHAAWGSVSEYGAAPAPFGSGPTTATASRTALGSVATARLTVPLAGAAGGTLTLGGREQHDRIGSVTVIDRSANATIAAGPLALSAWLGARRAPDERSIFAGGRLELALAPTVAVTVAAEQYPSNRVLGIAGGRAMSAGFILRTAPIPPSPPPAR